MASCRRLFPVEGQVNYELSWLWAVRRQTFRCGPTAGKSVLRLFEQVLYCGVAKGRSQPTNQTVGGYRCQRVAFETADSGDSEESSLSGISGDLTLVDKSLSGRLPVQDINAINKAVENQPSISTYRLSDFFAPSENTTYRHLKLLESYHVLTGSERRQVNLGRPDAMRWYDIKAIKFVLGVHGAN
ncbi:hypothetical protein EVAR_52569_1 [Eumeta japonica]|uniref:Uncharacterized protein n=1 Tax=Eumeta variegata TaxID=151549 RepID=A0A4C1YE62_EUMVA|nr:hypothetical protein EVAR_52569_1 [Eumeta japonica]